MAARIHRRAWEAATLALLWLAAAAFSGPVAGLGFVSAEGGAVAGSARGGIPTLAPERLTLTFAPSRTRTTLSGDATPAGRIAVLRGIRAGLVVHTPDRPFFACPEDRLEPGRAPPALPPFQS